MTMCNDGKFRCVKAILEMDEKQPDAFEKWKKKYPCVETCEKVENLCKALETVMNLEESEMLYKSGIIKTM
jgi:hypothetical protein